MDLSGASFKDVKFVGARLRNAVMDYNDLKWLEGVQLSGYLNIVGNMGEVVSALEKLTGVCATEDFIGFGVMKADDIKDDYKEEPDTVWPFVYEPRMLMTVFMPRKCE